MKIGWFLFIFLKGIKTKSKNRLKPNDLESPKPKNQRVDFKWFRSSSGSGLVLDFGRWPQVFNYLHPVFQKRSGNILTFRDKLG